MIHESYPWKQDLYKSYKWIAKYNTVKQLQRKSDIAYTKIEKAIFYSAFIIRKLIDCKTKVSAEVDRYSLTVEKVQPLKSFDLFHTIVSNDSHDWENPQELTILGKKICNWLIHSHIFFVLENKAGIIEGFGVSSDYDKNKALYIVSLRDWVSFMKFVASDDVVRLSIDYKNGDCCIKEKKRTMVAKKTMESNR